MLAFVPKDSGWAILNTGLRPLPISPHLALVILLCLLIYDFKLVL